MNEHFKMKRTSNIEITDVAQLLFTVFAANKFSLEHLSASGIEFTCDVFEANTRIRMCDVIGRDSQIENVFFLKMSYFFGGDKVVISIHFETIQSYCRGDFVINIHEF